MKRFKEILESKQPYLVLLVGTPLSGKSTFLKEHFSDEKYTLISRDEILMEVAGTQNYNEAYNILSSKKNGDKPVDKRLKYILMTLAKAGENVIIDMTNLRMKSRRKHLAKFPKHFKCAIIFDFLSTEEYITRNEKREVEENKTISIALVERMKASYEVITEEEGVDLIVNITDLEI